MDHVRVHRNSSRPAQLNAHAFAQGANIHLAPGQDRHLPHEAWHVVQQAQGRVRQTMQMKSGVAVNDDIGLEREADVMGARAGHQSVIDGRISDPVDGRYGSTETPLTPVNKHTAQLYRMYTEDEKISQGNELLLDGDRNLYAAPSKFAQANALPGVFHFTPGTRKTVYGWHLPKWLNHVDVSLKPDLDGIEDTVFGGQLTDGNGALLAAHTQHLVGDFAHANAGDRPHKSDANKQAYADRDDAMTGPLMPSDCGLAAEWVVDRAKRASDRFTAGAVQPGTMYLKQATGPAPAWDYHWAGVIMTDGADHVTMENAASKPTDGYSKRDLDKSWFFRMYGTAADQSFDAEYTGDMGAGGVSTDAPG